MTLIQHIEGILGNPPVGYEPVAYIFGGLVLIILVTWTFSLIAGIINSLTGR